MVPADPHLTVFVGDQSPLETHYTGHGHFYIAYANGLPSRLAKVDELHNTKSKQNPEIWDRKNKLLDTVSSS